MRHILRIKSCERLQESVTTGAAASCSSSVVTARHFADFLARPQKTLHSWLHSTISTHYLLKQLVSLKCEINLWIYMYDYYQCKSTIIKYRMIRFLLLTFSLCKYNKTFLFMSPLLQSKRVERMLWFQEMDLHY